MHKYISILLFIFIINNVAAQYGITHSDVIELKTKNQTKHLTWRYKRAAISIEYFYCNDSYCFELYEGDRQEKFEWFIFKWWNISRKHQIYWDWRLRLIPKRWYKHISTYYYLMDEEGNSLDIVIE